MYYQSTSFTTCDFKILDGQFYQFEAVLDSNAGLLHFIYIKTRVHMSHDARKPVFGVYDKVRHKPVSEEN